MQVVSYQDYRQVAQDGDIVFVCGSWKSIIQAIIMFFTGSRYVHVFLAFWMTTNNSRRLMVVEAQGGSKRRIISCSFYDDDKLVVIPAPKPWNQVEDVALQRVGIEDYSWITAIYVGLRNFVWNKLHIRLPRARHPSEICSEFVARVYQLPQRDVSPGELLQMLQQNQN